MLDSLFTRILQKAKPSKTLNVNLLSENEAFLVKGGLAEPESCPRCDAIGGTKPTNPPANPRPPRPKAFEE